MFYDKFKSLCAEKGVSCNRAALEIGLSNATPTTWKKRGLTPKGDTLTKIAEYFGVSVGYLLDPDIKKAPTDNDGREIPHAAYREVLQEGGIRLLLDTDAKVSEDTLQEIVEFIKFKQMRNDR